MLRNNIKRTYLGGFTQKKLTLVFAILVGFSAASSVSAAENRQLPKSVVETFNLTYKPQALPGGDIQNIPKNILPTLSAKKWSNGEYTVEGEGVYEYGKPCFSIEYKVDIDNRSYTLNPVANHNLDDSYLMLQAMDSKINPNALKEGLDANAGHNSDRACELPSNTPENSLVIPFAISPGAYDVTVSLRTRDFPNWTITKTSDRLRWYVYGNGTVYWLYWGVNWYAVNPSPINTHWYISQQDHWGPTYGAGSQNVTKSVYGSYYNYDWGWDHLSTTVSQYVSVRGNNNATVTYSWSHTDAGEDSTFIWGVISLN